MEEVGEYDGDEPPKRTSFRRKGSKPPMQKSKKKIVKRKRGRVSACLEYSKYEVVRTVCRERGWKEVGEDEDWILFWTDRSVAPERVMKLSRFQRINHFPGMSEIARKDHLAKNLNRMQKQFPKMFSFAPQTWILPYEVADLKQHMSKRRSKTYITKPVAGCQGRGIQLFKNIDEIVVADQQIVQEYIPRPYLINGYKFDLRIYVVVTCCDPLRVLLYKKGIARFCTEKYSEPTGKNATNNFMHLTNYAINKTNENFIFNTDAERADVGSKRSLQSVYDYIEDEGHDLDKLKAEINEIFIRTLIAIQPTLAHTYHTCLPDDVEGHSCFEILGFDILIDRKLKPILLEVNHSPSFTCDTPLDRDVKYGVISETVDMLCITSSDRKKYAKEEKEKFMRRLYGNRRNSKEDLLKQREERRAQHQDDRFKMEEERLADPESNFERICPNDHMDQYRDIFVQPAYFVETLSSKARREQTQRKLEEEKEKEKEKERRKKRTLAMGDKAAANLPPRRGSTDGAFRRLSNPTTAQAQADRLHKGVASRFDTAVVAALEGPPGLPPGIPLEDAGERMRIAERILRDRSVRATGVRERIVQLIKKAQQPQLPNTHAQKLVPPAGQTASGGRSLGRHQLHAQPGRPRTTAGPHGVPQRLRGLQARTQGSGWQQQRIGSGNPATRNHQGGMNWDSHQMGLVSGNPVNYHRQPSTGSGRNVYENRQPPPGFGGVVSVTQPNLNSMGDWSVPIQNRSYTVKTQFRKM